jgi:hypothetical protein
VLFPTVHNHGHILDETVDDLESLSCGGPSLILRQSVQSLQNCLDVLLSKKFLHKCDCVALSKVSYQRERTRSSLLELFGHRPEYGE